MKYKINSLYKTRLDTKTVEDWNKYVGLKPHNIGVVARMYKDHSLSFLTDGLRNVFLKDNKPSKFEISTSMVFEWQVETNLVKKIEFADYPEGDGAGGSEILFHFREKYYEKYDIFRIDGSRLQVQVLSRPVRKRDDYWTVSGVLIDNNYDTVLDTTYCNPGDTTTFQSFAFPEMSEEGMNMQMLSSVKLAA